MANRGATRRAFVGKSLAGLSGLAAYSLFRPSAALAGAGRAAAGSASRRPAILDSDIGDDIDDTWALLQLLRSPRLELKLALSDFGNAIYRSRLFAKLLELAGRADVPVGVGLDPRDEPGRQSGWIGDYQLQDYPGAVRRDGVQALIETIERSPEPVTLICIGPVPNIAEALRRAPHIAANARFVGMHGSLRLGYDGAPEPAAEWNVKSDPQALRQVFAAPWDCLITPLDSCGLMRLTGANYQKIRRSEDSSLKALMENYETWLPLAPFIKPGTDPARLSTTLFDTVAIYAAHSEALLIMEDLPVRVTDDGYTVIDEQQGRMVRCATGWKDLSAFENELTQTLLGARL